MKTVKITNLIPVRIVRNTVSKSPNSQWAKIVDARTNTTLHTGQIPYIKQLAKRRYNVSANL